MTVPPQDRAGAAIVSVLVLGVSLLGGCDDATAPFIPPTDALVLDRITPGREVNLLGLGESAHAAWVVRSRNKGGDSVRLGDGGRVTILPIEVGRGTGVLVGSSGEVLGPNGLLFSEGRLIELDSELHGVGFTADGRAWLSDLDRLFYWDGSELHEAEGQVPGLVALDGGIVWKERNVPLHAADCIMERGGARDTIPIPGFGCRPTDVASGGTALLNHRFIWSQGRLRSVDEMTWELPRDPPKSTRLRSVNRHGEAVGSFGEVPILVTGGRVLRIEDLDDPDDGWLWVSASDINDAGEILAMGLSDAGEAVVAVLQLER